MSSLIRHEYRKYLTPPPVEHGFTLIEMMIAMAIGLVLILGAVNIYAQGRHSFRTSESIARIQENGRFALDLMGPDIRLANFWGRNNEAAYITVPGGISVACGGVNATTWALDVNNGITGVDDSYNLPCPAFSGAQANTDVLIVRHATSLPTVPSAGRIQIQSARVAGELFDNGVVPGGILPSPQSATHDIVVSAYYVDQQSSLGAAVPSLRRKTLINGGVIQDQEIIPGVENLQIQFGVDTDLDGTVERYVDSSAGILTPGSATFLPDAEIIAVRIWMLIRSEQTENAYTNTTTYSPPDANLGNITPNDSFRRLPVSTTIMLRNARS